MLGRRIQIITLEDSYLKYNRKAGAIPVRHCDTILKVTIAKIRGFYLEVGEQL
jgi:hypothetical protein